MREIKFRAWDNKAKEWIKGFAIAEGGQLLIDQIGTSITFRTGFSLMQYTGLKDKNGKEIWEGDVVKDMFGEIFEVQWHKYSAGFTVIKKNLWNRDLREDDEVIGNIYENPELLD